MKAISAAMAGLFLIHAAGADQASAESGSAPVEYVLVNGQQAVPRDEYPGDFPERVEDRSAGGRANRWITGVSTPSLTVYLPAGQPTAAAVVCPGGGYGGLAFDKEGAFVAQWLSDRGIAAGVLKYPVFTGEPLNERPLHAAQLAADFLREKTGKPVGVVGFSAGGHLAATLANNPGDGGPLAFHALIYPVISMDPAIYHGGSRNKLIGKEPTAEAVRRMSHENSVTKQTPPAFLVHTADDRTVPFENSVRYYRACSESGVPAELHLYPKGGHGYGMWSEKGTVAGWPGAFEAWLSSQGLIAD